MTSFIQDVRKGAIIGFKSALTGYVLCVFAFAVFFAPVPFLFISGGPVNAALDMIWEK